MLEILALMRLVRSLTDLAKQKGRSKAWAMLGVAMWFGGELIGFFIGIALGLDAGAYLFAIVLAIGGAVGAWAIVKSLAPIGAPEAVVDTAVEGVAPQPNNPFSPPRR
jgi:hypothetical protein